MTVALFLSATSCTDEFLDTTPTDFISPANYYETEEHLEYALAAVYSVLASNEVYAITMLVWFANEADEGYYARENRLVGVDVHNYSPSEQRIEAHWSGLYNGIQRANLLLANIDKNPSIDQAIRDRIRGEALFLRSYYYFLLVQHFGAVPLIIEPTMSTDNVTIPRTPAKDVYERIIEDMERAEKLVPPITSVGFGGRISKSAVRGILARVNLYMAGYPIRDVSRYAAARDWAKMVMDDAEAGHELNSDYTQIFINYAQDKYDIKESIWEVEFFGNTENAYNETGRVGGYIGIPTSNRDIGNSYGFIGVTSKLYGLYEEDDVRRDWNIAPFTYNANGEKQYFASTAPKDLYNRRVGKYRREYEVVIPKANYCGPINWPLLRYSDVLLMYAEADSEANGAPTTEAIAALNEVRARANASLFEGENSIDDMNEFREVLYDERSRELAFEGMRKADLIRWGIFVPTMKTVLNMINAEAPGAYFALKFRNVSERDVLLPIPSREMALNKALVQNPNW